MLLLDVSITDGFFPLLMFSFTRCIPTPWIFACNVFSAVVQYGQSQGILSWGFRRFLLSERAARVSPSEFLGGLVVVRLSGGFFVLLLSLVPYLSWGISEIIGRTDLRLKGCHSNRGSRPDLSLKLRFKYLRTYQFPPRKSTRNRQTSLNPNVDKSLISLHQYHPRALTLSLLEGLPPPHSGYHYNSCNQYTGTPTLVIRVSWFLESGSVAPTNTK